MFNLYQRPPKIGIGVLLLKSGREKFLFAKGVYPYSYMTSREKFDETKLPPIEAFYDKLNDDSLNISDYEKTQKTWMHFGMQMLQNYHDHYLLSHVLLLADVFENFRNAIMKEHNLDCLHVLTLPSLARASALKFTGVKHDSITDPDAYLMIENNMRGGIATISHRHALANSPPVEGYYLNKSTNYLTYLDANNLYGDAMSNPLPVGKFQLLSQIEIDQFDLMSIPPDGDTGYIIECDLI